jgi:hypothetical protein
MRQRFEALHINNFAPDDENEALVFVDNDDADADATDTTIPESTPLSAIAGFDIHIIPAGVGASTEEPSSVPSLPTRRRTTPFYTSKSIRTRKLLTATQGIKPILGRAKRSADRATKFHEGKKASTRIFNAPTSMGSRAAKSRGYAGPLKGAAPPERGLIEIELGDGYVFYYSFNCGDLIFSQCRRQRL